MNSYHRDYDPRLRYTRNREECRQSGVNWSFFEGLGLGLVIVGVFWYVVAPKLWHLAYRIVR